MSVVFFISAYKGTTFLGQMQVFCLKKKTKIYFYWQSAIAEKSSTTAKCL
jgi:hypothetical protein